MQSIIKYFNNNSELFYNELFNHIMYLVLIPLIVDIIIGIVLGIFIAKFPKFKFIINIVSMIQNLPSLVLLTLMIMIGLGVGYLPAIVALIIYGLLPILSLTYTGITSINKSYEIIAKVNGISRIKYLFKIEIPMSMANILNGIRLSAIQISGLSVLANLIGAGGLGVFILTGIYQLQYHIMLVGIIPSMIITGILDLLLMKLINNYNKFKEKE